MNRDVDLYLEQIASHDFFKRFTQEQLNQILTNAIFHQYEKGQVLFFHGDPARDCFYLLKGAIRLEKMDSTGEYVYSDYVTEGTFFPYQILLSDKEYPYSGYSLTSVDLMLIPKVILESLVVDNMAQLLYMYQKISESLAFQEKRLQMTIHSSAYNRVVSSIALWMVDMGKKIKVDDGTLTVVSYPLTINELAIASGTTRETAGKVVRDLTDEKRLEFSRKNIIYYDEDYFLKLLE